MADEERKGYEITKRDTSPKLTDEVTLKLAKSVASGLSIPVACEANGLSWNTVKRWLDLGKKGRKPYRDFVDAMNEAKARFEQGAVAGIAIHGRKKDWKALAWLLERRYPERYYKPEKPVEAQQQRQEVVLFYPVVSPLGAEQKAAQALPGGPALVFPELRAPEAPVDAEGEGVDE